MSYVYLITSGKAVKIGVSNDPEKRLASLQTANHEPLKLRFEIRCSSEELAYKMEAQLHERYKAYRLNGEWFAINPDVAVNEIVFAVNLSSVLTGHNWWRAGAMETPELPVQSHLSGNETDPEPTPFCPKRLIGRALAYIVLLAVTVMLLGALVNNAPLTIFQIFTLALSGFYAMVNVS